MRNIHTDTGIALRFCQVKSTLIQIPIYFHSVRDKKTGKSKGFAFLCYENQKSTILAVDNFNGIKLTGRTIRVDHVEEYKVPKVGKCVSGMVA